MKRPIGMIRVSAGYLPRSPARCRQCSCIYNSNGVCDDPRTNRGNSDAACHKKGVAKLLDSLSEIDGKMNIEQLSKEKRSVASDAIAFGYVAEHDNGHVDLPAAAPPRLPGKIERRCPRCAHHSNHWLVPHGSESAIKATKLHTARCTDCGHQWPCRVMAKDL